MVAGTPHANVARKFLEFLTGEAGQSVFAQFGFGKP